jgi:hypothetical protein
MGQVAPAGIFFFDQLNFPVTPPILQLLLSSDRFLRRCERFDVDEEMHAIFPDEFRASAAAMLLEPVRRSRVMPM